ncbi:cytochrome P450 [Coniochaeta ligniaria NRRL 30616]|uniref:Cytochrome P450 n=1 Tax=Coniochaeta ligniaria NRRL 30616 TaxID=1408157 RepID=A0A1J7JIE4_9PEZI|nr:cytochrome P450 [Coniochaeta ligniaria NRRL 30616]
MSPPASPLLIASGAGILTLLLYSVARVVYLVFFHPLAKVPGPRLYAFSDIPYLYHAVRGEWPRTLKRLHDRYGPVVRFTQNDVSFITPGAWKQIYSHKGHGEQSYEKDLRLYRPALSGASSIITSNEADHRRMRRLLAHAFSEKALRGQEGIMKQYIDVLITRMHEMARKDEVVDMVKWYNFTTFDLIGDLAFGDNSFKCLDSGGYHPWVAMIFDGFRQITLLHALKRHPRLMFLKDYIMGNKITKSALEHFHLTQSTAKKRIESGKMDREDFMSYILRHNDEKGMTVAEMIENSSTLIVAGSETTATLLSGTTFYLLSNPHAYGKLVKEVRSTFATEEDITLQRVNQLEYMLAVLNEGLRVYPPVPSGLTRITPKGGEFIEGYWMPEKTLVSVAQWAAHQSEQNFRQPQEFIPERWLGDPRFASDMRDVVNPFSMGPRNCIGKNLAYAEMRLILARVLWNFDLEIMPDSRDWNKQDVYTLWEKGALNVKLTPVLREKVTLSTQGVGGQGLEKTPTPQS